MCTDMDWKIRKIVATEVKSIFLNCEIGGEYHETFVEEFKELLNDEESFVKIEAIHNFSEIIGHMTKHQVKEKFVDTIKEQYEQRNEECLQELAFCSGKIMWGFMNKGILDEEPDLVSVMRDFYTDMLAIEDNDVRTNAFYNLPFFYKEFRRDINFKPVFEDIANEAELLDSILEIIASCLIHLFTIADEAEAEDERPLLRRIFDKFLCSDNPAILKSLAE